MLIAFGRAALPGRSPAGSAPRAIALAFVCSIGALLALLDQPVEERQLTDSLYDYASRRRARHPARHPRRPAVGLHVPGGHRGLDPDPPLLARLHELRPRLRALLHLPQLLRLLDAAAGPRRQLRPPDRRLGVRRLRLLRADQLLVPARDRDQGRDEGVRDQRRRRHRPGARRLLRLPRARHLRLPGRLRRPPARPSRPTRAS